MNPSRKYHGLIGLVVLIVSETLMLSGIQPFTTWFYSLVWWSYIFLVDQVVFQVRGSSLWVDRRREFLLLIPYSVCIWMVFEGINFYLQNWYYIGIISENWLRWIGYFLAYGTVLPALFETYDLLDALGAYRRHKVRPIPQTTKWYGPFVLTGVLFLYLPLIRPQYFFPLVWGGFVFLLEPVVHARGGRSLMKEWENGSLRDFLLLLTAGFICGVLWEFWNFWAESKWVYSVPYVGFLKIFEMPILGFCGFPPFAVECFVMTNAVNLIRNSPGPFGHLESRTGQTPITAVILGVALFCLIFIMAARIIDLVTIRQYI